MWEFFPRESIWINYQLVGSIFTDVSWASWAFPGITRNTSFQVEDHPGRPQCFLVTVEISQLFWWSLHLEIKSQESNVSEQWYHHKMGPVTSYKWGEITPISRVLTPVKPIYFRPFVGVITTPFTTGDGAILQLSDHSIPIFNPSSLHPAFLVLEV